jgi:hypothetical protein
MFLETDFLYLKIVDFINSSYCSVPLNEYNSMGPITIITREEF